MKRKFWLIGSLSLLLIILLIIFFFIPGAPISYHRLISGDEAQNLLDLNQDALASANSASSLAINPIAKDDKIQGDLSAKIKMVVYENPGDIYSAQLAKNLKALQGEYSQDLVLAVRYYFPKNDQAAWASAMALECANKSGKFFAAREWLDEKLIKGEAVIWNEAPKDFSVSEICLGDEGTKKGIEAGLDALQNTPVYGAPTTFINGEIITGARSLDDNTNSAGEKLEGLRTIIKRYLGA